MKTFNFPECSTDVDLHAGVRSYSVALSNEFGCTQTLLVITHAAYHSFIIQIAGVCGAALSVQPPQIVPKPKWSLRTRLIALL